MGGLRVVDGAAGQLPAQKAVTKAPPNTLSHRNVPAEGSVELERVWPGSARGLSRPVTPSTPYLPADRPPAGQGAETATLKRGSGLLQPAPRPDTQK